MKRKGWIRLLSTVVALMLPLSAMAQSAAIDLLQKAKTDNKEIVSTITFVPGATLAADQVVADLSAATSIRINKLAGGYGALALVLNGVDSVAVQLRIQTEGLYALSETLGDKPLYFAWEDLQKAANDAMKNNGAGDASMGEFGKGFMSGMQQGFAGMLANKDGVDAKPMTEAEVKQKITEAMGGDDSFVKWIETIEAKKVVTTGEFTVEGSDTADTKTEIVATKEDMASLYDVPYIQKQITAQIKASDSALTDDQAAAKTKETVDSIKTELMQSDATMPITVYTKGEELVGLELTFTGNFTTQTTSDATVTPEATAETTAEPAATEAVKHKIGMYMVCSKKTADTGKTYMFKMNASQDDVKKADLAGTFTYNDQNANGTLTAQDGNANPLMTMNLTANYADAAHTTGQFDVTVNDAGKATAIVVGLDQVTGDSTIDTALTDTSC